MMMSMLYPFLLGIRLEFALRNIAILASSPPSETDLQYQLLTTAADDDTNRTSSFTLFCPKDSQLFNLDMDFNANVYVSTLRYHVIFHRCLIFAELQNLPGSFLDALLPHCSVLIGKIQNDSVVLNNGTTGVMVDGVRVTYLDIFVGSRIVGREIDDVLVTGLNKYSEDESDKNGLGVATTLEEWDNDQPSEGFIEGQSSSIGFDNSVGKEINEDLPSMFKMLASLSEEKNVEISLNLTIRKGRNGHELDS
ncbi:fasciclin-like arabinogalactan protein 19 [Forsythia ovata]|uniref:Fasciclin-like arabinogalactan protein 19 n=1 Tax=Forsythia ovata TaxID=205694 RepID=A0ABD1SJV3_9LAMI